MELPHTPAVQWTGYVITTIATMLGLFLILRPSKAIALQIQFYRTINWEMKPISMASEIRSTRVMGGMSFLLGMCALFFVFRS